MPDYNKPRFNKKPFGNKSFGNKGKFNDGPREMFTANCAKCGKVCEVPFRPNGSRPVYCNDCFVKDEAPRGDFNNRPPRREFNNSRPSFDRAPQSPRPDQAFNDLKAELRVVNQNLERLISVMTKSIEAPKPVEVEKKASKKKSK